MLQRGDERRREANAVDGEHGTTLAIMRLGGFVSPALATRG